MNLFATLDFEASSLNSESWPIEVGAVIGDGKVVVAEYASLIRPRPPWTMNGWDKKSEAIHKIERALLDSAPVADAVCDQLDAFLAGMSVTFDGGQYDCFWLERLYAGRPPAFHITPINQVPYSRIADRKKQSRVAHRALADARWLHAALGDIALEFS